MGTDETSISSIDPAGIALRAIQEQQTEIEKLKEANIRMEDIIKKIQQDIEDLKKSNKQN
jgi:FtsZ-binding cell division protein ZapB